MEHLVGLAPTNVARGGRLEITSVQTDVAADGVMATITAQTQFGPVPLLARLASLSALVTDLTQASKVMLARQMNGLDRGRSAMELIAADAPKVASSAAVIDGATGDIILIHRFADRPPFALRLDISQVLDVRRDIDAELQSRQH